jgi:segregation and condensation protein A
MPPVAEPYRIRLEHYYGPLDLLLHLVQVDEVDIFKIPIASIADQYRQYVETLRAHDLEMSGEFVAMTAHLLLLKSRAVVPPEPGEQTGEEGEPEEAPLLDLIRKLLEFRRVKELSARVGELMDARRGRWGRPRLKAAAPEPEGPLEVELWDLVVAYAQLVERTTLRPAMEIIYREIPVEQFLEQILRLVTQRAEVRFSEVLGDQRRDRGAVIGSFLALLELMKQQRVSAAQPSEGAEITIRPYAGG